MGLYDFTFYDLINRNAVSFPGNTAWIDADDGRHFNYKEYKQTVDKIGAGLQSIGIGKGDRIAVLGKNSVEFFLLYGTAAAIGAIVLPINWRLSPDEVAYNFNDCTPVIVFADNEFQKTIDDIKSKTGSIKHFYNLKNDEGGFTSFNLLKNEAKIEMADVSSDDDFVIIHTAAVSGSPRGAVLSHRNVLTANIHFNYYLNISSADVHLNILPLFHVGGLFMATNTFHAGGLNINMSKFDAPAAVQIIDEKKVTVMFDFSPILSQVVEEHKKSGRSIDSLKSVIGLDTPVNIEEYQKVTGGTFYCMYGQTETSCLATLGKYNDRPGSAGKMIQLAKVRLVDDNDGEVSAGNTGEITMKGPMIFKGYWNLPGDNAYSFRNGWHHTGDLGKFDNDGFLWYAGRKADKELIKPGGENVYPAEVEKAIMEHPSVQNTVVFGVPDPKWKEGIKAVCILKDGAKLDAAELIKFVGQKIASFKKPQYVQFVRDFPLLDNKTPDRMKIKEMYGGPQDK